MAGSRSDPPPHPPAETGRICHALAYYVLPSWAGHQPELLAHELAQPGIGARLYLMSCLMHGHGVRPELLDRFPVHERCVAGLRCFVLAYPPPAPLPDLSDITNPQLGEALRRVVLAPWFSALVILHDGPEGLRYFVLGQAPDGGTTLRSVDTSLNVNLGPGCEPDLERFVTFLEARFAR